MSTSLSSFNILNFCWRFLFCSHKFNKSLLESRTIFRVHHLNLVREANVNNKKKIKLTNERTYKQTNNKKHLPSNVHKMRSNSLYRFCGGLNSQANAHPIKMPMSFLCVCVYLYWGFGFYLWTPDSFNLNDESS